MVKRINAIAGMCATIEAMKTSIIEGELPERKDVFREETVRYIVDTVKAFDTGMWETGIEKSGDDWVIVEQYENREKAKTGHDKWVKQMEQNPKRKLKDINLWV